MIDFNIIEKHLQKDKDYELIVNYEQFKKHNNKIDELIDKLNQFNVDLQNNDDIE